MRQGFGFKGQSAIEYLMTYGWMLIVVTIAGGAVFSTAGQECPEAATGFSGNDLQVDDYGTGEELELSVLNSVNDRVIVEEVEVTDLESGDTRFITEETSISPVDTEVINFGPVTEVESCNQLELEITYSIEDGLQDQVVTGILTTSTGLEDVGSPSSPEDLNVEY